MNNVVQYINDFMTNHELEHNESSEILSSELPSDKAQNGGSIFIAKGGFPALIKCNENIDQKPREFSKIKKSVDIKDILKKRTIKK